MHLQTALLQQCFQDSFVYNLTQAQKWLKEQYPEK